MNDQYRKQLQQLMSQPQWGAFEAFFKDYMDRNFIQNSIKRNSEFETMWQAAENEGAKRMLNDFKDSLEAEARNV